MFNIPKIEGPLSWVDEFFTQRRQRMLDKQISNLNYESQMKNLEWLKYAQEKTWQREDNAVQRRKDDLVKAGLSPTLAAGSAAQAGPVIKTEAPVKQGYQAAPKAVEKLMQGLQIAQMFEGIGKTTAEKKLLMVQALKSMQDSKTGMSQELLYDAQKDYYENLSEKGIPGQSYLNYQKGRDLEYNRNIYKRYGIPTDAPPDVKKIYEAIRVAENAKAAAVEKLKKLEKERFMKSEKEKKRRKIQEDIFYNRYEKRQRQKEYRDKLDNYLKGEFNKWR